VEAESTMKEATMHEHRENRSWGEIASGLATVSVGLGILTMALFPLSVVGLLLFVIAPVALVVAPLVLIALLASPFVLLFRGARSLAARRPGRAETGALPRQAPAARHGYC
jgi:hypothetical protein